MRIVREAALRTLDKRNQGRDPPIPFVQCSLNSTVTMCIEYGQYPIVKIETISDREVVRSNDVADCDHIGVWRSCDSVVHATPAAITVKVAIGSAPRSRFYR